MSREDKGGRSLWGREKSGGGKGRDRDEKNRIKKNRGVVVAIKNFYAQWTQSGL